MIPVSRLFRKIIFSGLASWFLHSFRMQAGNLSGPPAEFAGMRLMALMISSSVISMSLIVASLFVFSVSLFVSVSGLLNTDWYCFWRMFAIFTGSS